MRVHEDNGKIQSFYIIMDDVQRLMKNIENIHCDQGSCSVCYKEYNFTFVSKNINLLDVPLQFVFHLHD